MHRAVAQSPIASRFAAASKRERERLRRVANETEDDRERGDSILREREEVIFRQLVRQQDELERVVSTLPLSERESFRGELVEALVDVVCIEVFRSASDVLLRGRSEQKSAVKVLRSLCDELKTGGFLTGQQIGRFIDALDCLDEISEIIHRQADDASCLIPKSRKTGGNFRWRVHFARLLVAAMLRRFEKPRYRLVADTINALIDVPDPVTEGSVRDAWRRRVRSGRFAAAYSDRQKRD
jgi:hypothetical protein